MYFLVGFNDGFQCAGKGDREGGTEYGTNTLPDDARTDPGSPYSLFRERGHLVRSPLCLCPTLTHWVPPLLSLCPSPATPPPVPSRERSPP